MPTEQTPSSSEEHLSNIAVGIDAVADAVRDAATSTARHDYQQGENLTDALFSIATAINRLARAVEESSQRVPCRPDEE